MPNIHKADEKMSLAASGHSLTRREWVQRMLAGAGAGAAVPALAEVNWVGADDGQAVAASPIATAEWKPRFLDDQQNLGLAAMAERIVPGSNTAQVNRFVDLALQAMPQETQFKFVAALNAIEGEARHQFTKCFRELSPGQQDQVLSAASEGQATDPSLGTAMESSRGTPLPVPRLRDYFEYLKTWVSMAYYSSEIGMKELGWDGESFYESYPGCEHAGGHA